jgi:hypothetical protein
MDYLSRTTRNLDQSDGRGVEAEQRRQVVLVLAEFLSQSAQATDRSWLEELRARGTLYGTTAAESG